MKKFKDLMGHVRMEEAVKNDPCWKGYEMVGMKDKNGKKVPNCVPTKEEVVNEADKDPGEYDQEGDMAMTQLRSIIYHAQELHDQLDKNDNLPEWVQSKITLAQDYMQTACDYMYSQKNESVEIQEEKQQHTHVTTQDMQFSGHGKTHTVKKGSHMRYVEGSKQMYVHLKNGKPVEKTHPILSIPHEFVRSVNEEVEHLEEGRPSQRHPLEGHEYHRKTDAELIYIAKDAHKAAEAMKSHNTAAENKYRDQANDSATVRYYRQKHGMADWYKKKYGHIKEEAEQINELSDKTLTSYAQKVHDDSMKHDKDPSKRPAEKRNKSVMGFSRAINKLEARPQNEEVEQVDEAMSASYRMALALKREKERREEKDKAREARGDRFTTGPAQKPTPVQSHVTSESVNEQTASKLGQEREEVPFDKPYKTTKSNVTDKSGAKHTPMSRAKHLAKMAARKAGGIKEESEPDDSYQKNDTLAKRSLSKTAGMVKDLSKNAKTKKGSKADDKFEPEPELSSQIVKV